MDNIIIVFEFITEYSLQDTSLQRNPPVQDDRRKYFCLWACGKIKFSHSLISGEHGNKC